MRIDKARGMYLDMIAIQYYGLRRQWLEHLPIIGDRLLRARCLRTTCIRPVPR